jgi:hypothetical protein
LVELRESAVSCVSSSLRLTPAGKDDSASEQEALSAQLRVWSLLQYIAEEESQFDPDPIASPEVAVIHSSCLIPV